LLGGRFPHDLRCIEDRAVGAAQSISPTLGVGVVDHRHDTGLARPQSASHVAFHANVTRDALLLAELPDEVHHPLRPAGVHGQVVGVWRVGAMVGRKRLPDMPVKPERSVVGADNHRYAAERKLRGGFDRNPGVGRRISMRVDGQG